MYVRGGNTANEYRRVDHTFYRGVVVATEGYTGRVKIFIPELANTNTQYDPAKSNDEYNLWNLEYNGDVISADISFSQVVDSLPWAEQCSPIFGGSGAGGALTPDAPRKSINYTDAADAPSPTTTNENFTLPGTPSLQTELDPYIQSSDGNMPTVAGGLSQRSSVDAHPKTASSPTVKSSNSRVGVNNPNSDAYAAPSHSGASGAFSTVDIGARVWVFMKNGNLNFPVYFGLAHSKPAAIQAITGGAGGENMAGVYRSAAAEDLSDLPAGDGYSEPVDFEPGFDPQDINDILPGKLPAHNWSDEDAELLEFHTNAHNNHITTYNSSIGNDVPEYGTNEDGSVNGIGIEYDYIRNRYEETHP